MTAPIKCHPSLMEVLPEGWSLGAYISFSEGGPGYWALHTETGASVVLIGRPDYEQDEDAWLELQEELADVSDTHEASDG